MSDVETEKAYLLSRSPTPTVAYYDTEHVAIYRVVAGFSAWVATPGSETWRRSARVLDHVTGATGSADWTPRISRADALAKLKEWGLQTDELDTLPEA